MHQRRLICIVVLFFGLLAGIARADTFQLTDGTTVTGDVLSGDENGLRVKVSDDSYPTIPWGKFSQDNLKKFANDPGMQRFKLGDFVTPFIEVSQEEKREKTDVGPLKEVPRLNRPAAGSFFGAMLSSSVGFFVLLLLYASGIYAAYEVAMFRRRPRGLVCGLAAIPGLGFLSPIIFLSLPTFRAPSEEAENYQPEAAPAAASPGFTVPGVSAPPAPVPASAEGEAGAAPETHGLKLAHSAAPGAGSAPLPEPQIFQRGAFMFNRRFFETKFPGFFGVVRREAEKDMVLKIKAARGEYVVDRISRITANDMHAQVRKGNASEELMIPFTEVQEVQYKHKDSP